MGRGRFGSAMVQSRLWGGGRFGSAMVKGRLWYMVGYAGFSEGRGQLGVIYYNIYNLTGIRLARIQLTLTIGSQSVYSGMIAYILGLVKSRKALNLR